MAEDTLDFEAILNMNTVDAVKPPPMPTGTYRALLNGNEMVRSREKQTPGVQIEFLFLEPMADVDVDRWNEYLASPAVQKDKITRNESFWITERSAYRLKEVCLKAIKHDEDKDGVYDSKMGKLIADAMKQTILVKVVQTVNRQSGDVFNEITGYAVDE